MKPARTPRCEHGNRHTKEDTGGLVAAPAMKDCTQALCVECPLRRDAVPGYLGGYSPEMYLAVLHSPASIACHMTPGFRERDISRQHHCTGVAAYRANVGHIAQIDGTPTGAHRSTQISGQLPGVPERVFASPQEFFDHHAPGQERNPE